MESTGFDRLMIQGSVLFRLPEFMASCGLSYVDLAQAVGLSPDVASDDTRYISLNGFAKLLEVGSVVSGDEVFALRFAEQQDVGAAGALAYAIRNAPTVRDGIVTMIRFIGTRVDLAQMELVTEGTRARIEWLISPLVVQRTQLADYAAASIVRRIAPMIDSSWKPIAVHLERPPPRNLEAHRRVFGRLIHFRQPMNTITMDAGSLDLPVLEADPHLYRLATDLLRRILTERQQSADLVTQLREEVTWALGQDGGPEMSRIARRLGMSVRSLQRRLADENTSFQSLVDSTRSQLALRYLEDPKLSFSQIAYRLGFAASSAFTRACSRWFGATPSEMRRSLLGYNGRAER